MTFGQHLEELRRCLFKAILGLTAGCLIGLLIGGYVVEFIQKPVRDALADFYEEQSARKVQKDLERLRDAGYALPADVKDIKNLMAKNSLTFEEVYINPKELARQLQLAGKPVLPAPPAAGAKEFSKEDLVKVFLWREVADDPRIRMKGFNFQEPFMIWLKASFLVGAILASPWVFYQIWSFVAAGLYRRERRYIHVYLPFSVVLFLAGAALAFFCVFPPVLKFLLGFNTSQAIDPELRFNEWLGFVLMLPLGFGISFQLPLVMLFLERIGVFTIARLPVVLAYRDPVDIHPRHDPHAQRRSLQHVPDGRSAGAVVLRRRLALPLHAAAA